MGVVRKRDSQSMFPWLKEVQSYLVYNAQSRRRALLPSNLVHVAKDFLVPLLQTQNLPKEESPLQQPCHHLDDWRSA